MAIKLTVETSLLDVRHGTTLEVQVRKPHAGAVQIVLVAPDGRYKVLTEWTLMVDDLIAQNAAGEDLPPVPTDWTFYNRKVWERMKQESV